MDPLSLQLAEALAELVRLAESPEIQEDDAMAHPDTVRVALENAHKALSRAGME